MDSSGNAHFSRHTDNRACRIAACPDSDIGFETVDYLSCSLARCGKICDSLDISSDVFKGYFSLKACHLDSFQLVACLRDELCFHALRSACKEELRIGIFAFDDVCDSEAGIDMSACASARYENFHAFAPFSAEAVFFLSEVSFSDG